MPLSQSKAIRIASLVFIIVASLVGVKALFQSGIGFTKDGVFPQITVSGTGESYATPDIATISFDITKETKTVADAQQQVSAIISKIQAALVEKGVAEKDIKTEYYNVQPVYDYVSNPAAVYCSSLTCPSTIQKSVLRGYQVSHGISIKVRALDKSGEIVALLGDKGATNIGNVSFSVENPDEIQATARKQAIDEAVAKAQVLAKDLGVHLVRITSFNENGTGGIYPMYKSFDAAVSSAGAPIALPTGENKVVSNVTITYEIR